MLTNRGYDSRGCLGPAATATAALANKLRVGVIEAQDAKDAASQVILDTNAVFKFKAAQALVQAGESPVVTDTTRAELANVASREGMSMPHVADTLHTIRDVMEVNTRINIRGALDELKPGQPGIFGDGSIGATVLDTGLPFITGDRLLSQVLTRMAGSVRLLQ